MGTLARQELRPDPPETLLQPARWTNDGLRQPSPRANSGRDVKNIDHAEGIELPL
jgi:hypothetical protein